MRLWSRVCEEEGFRYSVWFLVAVLLSLHVAVFAFLQSLAFNSVIRECVTDPRYCLRGVDSKLKLGLDFILPEHVLATQAGLEL